MKRIRVFVIISLIMILLAFLVVLIINLYMVNYSKKYILSIDEAKELDAEYIVVLGARVYQGGRLSAMLEDRVKAGVALYEEGAAPKIIMSGDSHRDDYDEVNPMMNRATELGVPVESILTDSLGLSTYESMERLKEEFGATKVIICTQEYHMYRALYNARKLGLEAYGYPAEKIEYANQAQRDLREIIARVKDFMLVIFTT